MLSSHYCLKTALLYCLTCLQLTITTSPQYNEAETKLLMNIAAAAYSSNPQICVNKTMPAAEEWRVYNRDDLLCDAIDSTCSSFIIISDVAQKIIVSFRGTKTEDQLFMEGWDSLLPEENFFGKGLVNPYFLRGINVMWPKIEPLLNNSEFSSYEVTFTGHSLGAALASLAAARTAVENLRNSSQIKLITYGQPRVGDLAYAKYHDQAVPYSFRLVHSQDIVPHMPACEKNTSNEKEQSKPCLDINNGKPYHHGIEIWYPHGMGTNAKYNVCLGNPKDEDLKCSDSLTFKFDDYKLYIKEHRHYFDTEVPLYGEFGCVNDSKLWLVKTKNSTVYSTSFAQKLKLIISALVGNIEELID